MQTPLQRTLLALGPKATVRYYGCGGQAATEEAEIVDLVYAITYDDPQGKRPSSPTWGWSASAVDDGRADWQLIHAEAGNVPLPGW